MGNIFQWQLRLPLKTEGIIGRNRLIDKKFAFTIGCYEFCAAIAIKIVNSKTLCEYIRTEGFVQQPVFLDNGIRCGVVFKNKESVVVVIRADNLFASIAIEVGDGAAREKRGFPDNLVGIPVICAALHKKSSLIICGEYFQQTVCVGVIHCPCRNAFQIREIFEALNGMC